MDTTDFSGRPCDTLSRSQDICLCIGCILLRSIKVACIDELDEREYHWYFLLICIAILDHAFFRMVFLL